MRTLLRATAFVAMVSVGAYATFFVPLDRLTLADHIRRIMGTQEAQDLAREAQTASQRIEQRIVEKARDELAMGNGNDEE